MGVHDDESIFLTQEEQELFLPSQTNVNEEAEETKQQDFENAIMEVHRQYKLRSKKTSDTPTKKAVETKKVIETKNQTDAKNTSNTSLKKIHEKNNVDSSRKMNPEISQRSNQTKVTSSGRPNTSTQRIMTDRSEMQNQGKTSTTFSLEGELAKLKIHIPLTDLMSKNAYRSQVIKALSMEPEIGTKALNIGSGTHLDTVNLIDNQPELLFGPEVDGQTDNGVVLPFYISLNVHDKILHNTMLNSGASHNLMSKVVMEKLGLDVTRPYKDLHSFDSSKAKCIGLIKYLCITLAQIPVKSMVMDVVVADIPPKYDMLLSRSWGENLRGTLQLDMSYATVPVIGQQRRMYRETLKKYMVSNQEKPHNYPLYSAHSDMDSFILYNADDLEGKIAQLEDDTPDPKEDKEIIEARNAETMELPTDFWSMDFDGAVSKEGAGAGVWLHNHISRYSKSHSYKLNFQCTNNIDEYKALVLNLKLLKKVGSKHIMVRGDSELIIKKVKGEYAAKHPRLRAYRNAVLDALQFFTEIDLQVMPRGQNILADGLATSAATCKIPFRPTRKYTVEVKCRPTVPDNIR
jgi:ribonuclease HI